MALTTAVQRGETSKGLAATLIQLLDEHLSGVLQLDESGAILEVSDGGQELLRSAAGKSIEQTLREVCARSGPMVRPAELVLNLGGSSEIRILLVRSGHRPGFAALIERSVEARLRGEVRVLRAMLALASDGATPREAASRALALLAQAMPTCALVLHEIDREKGQLTCAGHANLSPAQAALAAAAPLDGASGTFARAAQTGAPAHVADLSRSPFAREREIAGEERLALLAMPVKVAGAITAVLGVCGPAGVLGEGELRMVQGLADALGTLLDRARRVEEIASDRAARRSLMDNLPDAILEQGADGRISLAGGRVEVILGRRAEDLVGHSLVELLAEEERELFSRLLASLRDGTPCTGEFQAAAPDGRKVPCEVSVHKNGADERAVVRAVFRDISARKALEADVVRAREIATRRERLAAIGQLAAGVAHEINNPLSFVKSNLSSVDGYLRELESRAAAPGFLAPARAGEPPFEEILRDLREISEESRSGIDRIASIVQALKGMARNRTDDRIVFNPAQAINDAAIIFRGAKHRCQVEVEMGALPSIRGSPGALGQVLLNLLDNALDAMGGSGTIQVKAAQEGTRLRVSVEDRGGGIPADVREHLFEPFFTTKESGKGTGLGLFICYEIVKQMNGEISVDSGPTGTIFTIDLPIGP
jgi:two-component system NtrC family sensor kinase